MPTENGNGGGVGGVVGAEVGMSGARLMVAIGVALIGPARCRSAKKFESAIGIIDDSSDVHARNTADRDADVVHRDAGRSGADGNRAGHHDRAAAVEIDELDGIGADFGYGSDVERVIDRDRAGRCGSGEGEQSCRARADCWLRNPERRRGW